MKHLPFYAFIFAVIINGLLSCKPSSTSAAKASLQYADSLLEIYPDSALSFLRSLPVENYSEAEQVLYGVLLTSATDKNELSILPCDSLIDAALDYYDKGDGYNRARALFYKGRIQFSMNMIEEAMANCYEALGELNYRNTKEIKLQALLYDDLGECYLNQMLDEIALQMFRLSYYCDSLVNNVKGMAYSLRDISNTYVCLDNQDSALLVLTKIQMLLPKFKDSLFVSDIYRDLSYNFDDLDSAMVYAKKAILNLPAQADSSSYFHNLGDCFLEIHCLDSAEFYLKKAYNGNLKTSSSASLSLAEVAQEKKDYQLALTYYLNYISLIDSIFATNQASNIERLSYKYEAKADILRKEKEMQQSIFFIVLAFVLVILLSIIIMQMILRKRKIAQLIYEKETIRLNDKLIILQSDIAKTEAEIETLRQIHSDDQDKIREKEKLVSKMIDEKAEIRNFIFSNTPIYHLIQKLSKQDREDKKNIRVLNLKEQETLRKTVSEIYSEHISYLRTTYNKMSEDDILYSCLQLCKFDDYTIAYCFGNTNKQIVVQRRFRLKEKMTLK